MIKTEAEIELRTSILLGINDLRDYVNMTMTKDEITKEK